MPSIVERPPSKLDGSLVARQVGVLAQTCDAVLYLLLAVVGGIAAGILGVAQFNYQLDNLPRLD